MIDKNKSSFWFKTLLKLKKKEILVYEITL